MKKLWLLVAGLVLLCSPRLSFAQNFITGHVEGQENSEFSLDSEAIIKNTSAGPLCVLVYSFDTDGNLKDCCGYSLFPDSELEMLTGANLYIPDEGSVDVISSLPNTATIACDPRTPKPFGSVQGWIELDDSGAVGMPMTAVTLGGEAGRLATLCKNGTPPSAPSYNCYNEY